VDVTEWEPATDAEIAMRNALRTDDQESYFRILAGVDLLLPVSADALAGLAPLGWGTWSTGGRTHVLAFTSPSALQACLADYTGSARRVAYAELADTWPNLEWWLAVNPGLPIEGYLPAWFVAQLSRGDLRLPTRGPGPAGSNAPNRIQDLHAAATLAATAAAQGYNASAQNYAAPESGGPIQGSPAPTSASGGSSYGASGSGAPGPGDASHARPDSRGSAYGGGSGSGDSAYGSATSGGPAYGGSGYGGPGGAVSGGAVAGGAGSAGLAASSAAPGAASTSPGGSAASTGSGYAGGPTPGSRFSDSAAGQPADAASGGQVGPGGLPLRTPGAVLPSGLPSRVPGTPAGQDGGIPGGQFNGFGTSGGARPAQPGGYAGQPAGYGTQSDSGVQSDERGRPGGAQEARAFAGDSGGSSIQGGGARPAPGASARPDAPIRSAGDVPAAYRPPTVPPSDPARAGSSGMPARSASAPSALDALGSRSGPGPSAERGPGSGSTPGSSAAAQRSDSPLPTRTPMAQTPPLPAHIPPPPDTDDTAAGDATPGQPALGGAGAISAKPAARDGAISAKLAGQAAAKEAGSAPVTSDRTGPGAEQRADDQSKGPGGLPRRQVAPPEERPSSMAAAAQALAGNRNPASTQPSSIQQPSTGPATGNQPGGSGQSQVSQAQPGLAPPVIPGAGGAGRSTTVPAAAARPTIPPASTDQRPATPGSTDQRSATPGSTDQRSGAQGSTDQRSGTPGSADQPTATPAPADRPQTAPTPADRAQTQQAPTDRSQTTSSDSRYPSRPQPSTDPQTPAATRPAAAGRGMIGPAGSGPTATGPTATGSGMTGSGMTGDTGDDFEDDFAPANEVERDLYRAVDEASTDSFLSTLLLATVLVPVAHNSRPGSAPGESGFAFRTEEIEGDRFLVVFTSRDRLAEHFAEPTRTVGVRFVDLIRNWPDPAWSFAVNPTSPIGARYPGPQVIALASWAVEAGLGGDPVDAPAELPQRPAEPTAQLTVMQKAVPAEQIDYYLERGYDRVAGFVHRAGEVEHLRTPGELFAALGLLYDGSPYQADANEAFVLRWPAHRPSLYRIPYGGQSEQALRAMDGWVIERPPFRGNGFAPGEGKDVIAEFKVDSVRLPHGAQLWRIADSAEQLIAVFDCDAPVWRRVGER
jgi:hypothetical protein